MNKLIAQFLGWLLVSGAAHAFETQPVCPSMQVAATAEGKAGADTKLLVTPDAKDVRVARTPLLTLSDFTDANVSLTEGQIVLNVGLTPQASKRWMEFTAKNVGRSVAFIVDDRVLRTPRIVDPNLGKGLLLGPFDKKEAEQLAAAINHPDRRCRSTASGDTASPQ